MYWLPAQKKRQWGTGRSGVSIKEQGGRRGEHSKTLQIKLHLCILISFTHSCITIGFFSHTTD